MFEMNVGNVLLGDVVMVELCYIEMLVLVVV